MIHQVHFVEIKAWKLKVLQNRISTYLLISKKLAPTKPCQSHCKLEIQLEGAGHQRAYLKKAASEVGVGDRPIKADRPCKVKKVSLVSQIIKALSHKIKLKSRCLEMSQLRTKCLWINIQSPANLLEISITKLLLMQN